MLRAQALVGLNVVGKTFATGPVGPYVVAYALDGLPEDPHQACEVMWLWSNGEGHLRVPLDMRCRAQRSAQHPPAYNGPSLSIGDLVHVMDDSHDDSWWRCADIGFAPVADPAAITIEGDTAYTPPRATPLGAIITPGSDWKVWMDRMIQETIREH